MGKIKFGLNAILFLNKWGLTSPDSGSRDQRDITYWKREETVLKTQTRALGVLETFELALPEATEERMAGFP